MNSCQRCLDYLVAACIVTAFGAMFLGRMLIYPVTTVPGTFLERVAATSDAWDVGHRWMLLGLVGVIPVAIGLRRAMHDRSPWLTDLAAALTLFGAVLCVGQYALDFAMLAAAQVQPPEAGAQFLKFLQADSFVEWVFYKLPDVSQIGLILFTIALWRQGATWRLQASLVTIAAATFIVGPFLFGALADRVALGLLFVGFSTVAWKIVARPALPVAEPAVHAAHSAVN